MTREEALEILKEYLQEDIEVTEDKVYYNQEGRFRGYKYLKDIDTAQELLPELPKFRVEEILRFYKRMVEVKPSLEKAIEVCFLSRFPEEIVKQAYKNIFND